MTLMGPLALLDVAQSTTGSAVKITVLQLLLNALSWPRGSLWSRWPRSVSAALMRPRVLMAAAQSPIGPAALVITVPPLLLTAKAEHLS